MTAGLGRARAGPATAPTDAIAGALRRLVRNRLAAGGLAVFGLITALAVAAPLLPLPDPNATAPANRLLGPGSPGHLLGTDALGRDLLSRLIWGTRVSLAVGLAASVIAAVAGSTIGLIAGYAGGRTDALLMRGIDMMMAFPYILLALVIVAVLGPGLLNALYAIALVNIPFFARTVRGVTLGLARRDFIDAARLSGKGHSRILATEILPNVLPVIVVTLSTTLGWMILETAGLSFLGLGAQPPQADLGSMLGEGRKVLFTAPHVSVIPGLMILALVMAINLLGDGLRDLLDPRLQGGGAGRPGPRTVVDRTAAPPTPSHPGATLELAGLVTRFDQGATAIRDVDLHVRPGECLGLVGESGSGKSVAAMSVMGLVPSPPGRITAGAAWLDGDDLLSLDDQGLRRLRGATMACVFQDPLGSLHPLSTIGTQLIEAIQVHEPMRRAAAKDRAEQLLAQVRVPSPRARLDAFPHELSGGLRQRVCIAMALAHSPALLIADEPTTALDVTVQAQILALLNRLRRKHDTAILFITHDFGVVSALCDRVAVMYAGQIVESGPTDAILQGPAHPYTAGLIASVPVLGQPERRAAGIPGRPPQLDQIPDGCAFASRCPAARPACQRVPVPMTPLRGDRTVRCHFPLAARDG